MQYLLQTGFWTTVVNLGTVWTLAATLAYCMSRMFKSMVLEMESTLSNAMPLV